MRIGIVPNLDRSVGGTYQYAVTMVSALTEMNLGDEFTVFLYAGEELPPQLSDLPFPSEELRTVAGLAGSVWGTLSDLLPRSVRAAVRRLLGVMLAGRARVADRSSDLVDPMWARWFRDRGIDLLIFTNDSDLSYRTGIPFVVAVHDLQHRLHPEFAEVSAGGEGERRESRVGHAVRGATLVLVDSEVGKEDMLRFYGPEGVAADSVRVLPFLPADYIGREVPIEDRRRVRARWSLPGEYFFYPAQFAPSKNHVRIVEALGVLKARGVEVPIVFVGGSSEAEYRQATFAQMTDAVLRLGIQHDVIYLGYVPDEDMPALYAESIGLVMPTFFGPTNIPILEAWSVGCPVLTSDIRGVRDQAGDAAILVDPESVASIAEGMLELLDPASRSEMAQRGRVRLAAYTRADFVERLEAILVEARARVLSCPNASAETRRNSERAT